MGIVLTLCYNTLHTLSLASNTLLRTLGCPAEDTMYKLVIIGFTPTPSYWTARK